MSRHASRSIVARIACIAAACSALSGGRAADGPPSGAGAIRQLLDAGRYAAAEQAARPWLAAVERESGRDSLAAAQASDLLVEALWRGRRVKDPEALALAQRAVRLKEAALGPRDLEVARSLSNLGNLARMATNYEIARQAFERTLQIREAALGADDPDVANTLGNLGNLWMELGEFTQARAAMERALEIRSKRLPSGHPDIALSYQNLSALLRNTGDYGEAIVLLESALALREKEEPPNEVAVATCLNNLSELRRVTGDLGEARRLSERTLAIHERVAEPDYFRWTEALGKTASLCAEMGDFGQADRLFGKAMALALEKLGADHFVTGFLHNAYGVFLRKTGDDSRARRELEEAVRINDKAWGSMHPLSAIALQDLADLLREIGEGAAARPLYEQALAFWERSPYPNHPAAADAFVGLAGLRRDTGDVAASHRLYERALGIETSVLGQEHPQVAMILLDRAQLEWAARETPAALDDSLRGEAMLREHLRSTARSLPEADALRYESIMRSGLDIALSLLGPAAAAGPPEATIRRVWDQLIRSRAIVLDEMARRHRRVLEGEGAEVAALAETLATARRTFAGMAFKGPDSQDSAGYRAAWQRSRAGMDRAEHALAQKSTAFQAERKAEQAGLKEVATALPAGAALVSYATYSHQERGERGIRSVPSYMALVLARSDAAPAAVQLGAASRIDALVKRWREEAGSPPGDAEAMARYAEAGEELRRALWDPIAGRLAGARQAFIVPEGAIHLVNLATLPTPGGRFLVESGPLLHSLSAERDLLRAAGPRDMGKGLLLLGGPDFDAADSGGRSRSQAGTLVRPPASGFKAPTPCGDTSGLRFTPLPSSLAEADEVEALWTKRHPGGGATAGQADASILKLTGIHAVEEAFRQNAPGRRVLHLATHGFFEAGECEANGQSGNPAPRLDPGTSQRRAVSRSPLLLSGLALAGANRRTPSTAAADSDDGVLTAEEIASLDLRGVEWAVLSACETGVGPVQTGEGVLGLRRSFEVAGAKSLIISLWPVSDHDARAWIRRLYEARLQGLSTAESVRRAGLGVIEDRRRAGAKAHPFFWGAFVATGDWR